MAVKLTPEQQREAYWEWYGQPAKVEDREEWWARHLADLREQRERARERRVKSVRVTDN